MPSDALPQPRDTTRPDDQPSTPRGVVSHSRRYNDPLGRPMKGAVVITPTRATASEGAVVPVSGVSVTLVNGVLDVALAPGVYTFTARLTTVDGAPAAHEDTVLIATE